jgi:hypothetical protein
MDGGTRLLNQIESAAWSGSTHLVAVERRIRGGQS